jgi:creatinine amidohydrolase
MKSLFDLPHAEARRLVQTGAPVYLTCNPVEYHGPHLSLHNDKLVSRGLIRELHGRLQKSHPEWELLLASDLEVGVEPCWGPGSRHTRYQVACELVREACRALAELGARRVVLMTFHGSPLHNVALDEGVQLLRARGVHAIAPFNIVLQQLVKLDPNVFAEAFAHVEDPVERAQMIRGLPLDFHAGFFETSVALQYAPEAVSDAYKTLAPCPEFGPTRMLSGAGRLARAIGQDALAGELGFAAVGTGWYKLKPFPGYTGRPHRATREAGKIFGRFMMEEFEPAVSAVLEGRSAPPAPIMPWVRWATLAGRIGGVRVGADQMEGIDGL